MSAPAQRHDGARLVAVGGGHGLNRTLRALSSLDDAGTTTAIVAAADDGGSSGRLRRDLGVVPPGDLRMALAALTRHAPLRELLQYRFERGELEGHSLGNLLLVACQDLAGDDVVAALDRLGALLGVRGRVLPSTAVPLTLHAVTAGGRVDGQVEVALSPHVERVWVEPADAPAVPDAVRAITAADLVVLGPGSVYTSLLPNLLVDGIAAALAATAAPVALVANLREQPGETEGMALHDHLAALRVHVPGLRIDVVVAHAGPAPQGPGRPLVADASAVAAHQARLVTADLLDGADGHDPHALGEVLCGLVSPRRKVQGAVESPRAASDQPAPPATTTTRR